MAVIQASASLRVAALKTNERCFPSLTPFLHHRHDEPIARCRARRLQGGGGGAQRRLATCAAQRYDASTSAQRRRQEGHRVILSDLICSPYGE
jgi:hypothetical protein